MTYPQLLPYAIPFGTVIVAGILWFGRLEWRSADHEARLREVEDDYKSMNTMLAEVKNDVKWIREALSRRG